MVVSSGVGILAYDLRVPSGQRCCPVPVCRHFLLRPRRERRNESRSVGDGVGVGLGLTGPATARDGNFG